MLLVVDKFTGRILDNSLPYENGVNFIDAEPMGIVDMNDLTIKPFEGNSINSEDNELSLRICGTEVGGIFHVNNNYLKWICPDFSGSKDLFYIEVNSNIILISDNFWEITQNLNRLTLDGTEIVFFLKRGYCSPGKTVFTEIKRISPGDSIIFSGESFNVTHILPYGKYLKLKTDFDVYKKCINSVFDLYPMTDHDIIYFSGGVDSGLISALGYLKFKVKPTLITLHYKPKMYITERDLSIAERVSNYYGARHIVVEADFNKLSPKDIEPLINLMPLSAHGSYSFLEMAKKIASSPLLNTTGKIWCGQNNDTLYDLQLSGQGELLTTKIRLSAERLPISKYYLRSLLKSNSYLFNLNRIILGKVIEKIFSAYYHDNYFLPKTFGELRKNILQEKSVFSHEVQNKSIYEIANLSSLKCRQILFDDKLCSHMCGGDHRVVLSTAKLLTDRKCVLPYSFPNLIHFYRNLELSFKDILQPKRFTYMYLKELLEEKIYRTLYLKPSDVHSSEKHSNWDKKILEETIFGQELTEEVQTLLKDNSLAQFYVKKDCLDSMIAWFWILKVISALREKGVLIRSFSRNSNFDS
jgi:hypothetical protein